MSVKLYVEGGGDSEELHAVILQAEAAAHLGGDPGSDILVLEKETEGLLAEIIGGID